MTQDEISELARKAGLFGTFIKHKDEIETFAKLVAEKEYEKTSAWYRKLIADIVEDVHKQYEKKKLRTRTTKPKVKHDHPTT
jgi:hypothetical protein